MSLLLVRSNVPRSADALETEHCFNATSSSSTAINNGIITKIQGFNCKILTELTDDKINYFLPNRFSDLNWEDFSLTVSSIFKNL